jgi:hypothetical protein
MPHNNLVPTAGKVIGLVPGIGTDGGQEDNGPVNSADIDVADWVGLSFNPEAAFIDGIDRASSPADVSANLFPDDFFSTDLSELPGVDDTNEVRDTTDDLSGLVPDRALLLIALFALALVAVNAFASGAAEGITS